MKKDRVRPAMLVLVRGGRQGTSSIRETLSYALTRKLPGAHVPVASFAKKKQCTNLYLKF